MFDQLEDLKKQSEESNKRLAQLITQEAYDNGVVSISMNGHRTITDFQLNDDFKSLEKEDLEDLIYLTFNKTLERVNKINEDEVMNSAKSIFPGF